jgi:hypothetical protein
MYRVKHVNQLPTLETFTTVDAAIEYAKQTIDVGHDYFFVQQIRAPKLSDLIADSDMVSIFKTNAAGLGVADSYVEDLMNPVDPETGEVVARLEEEFTNFIRESADWWTGQYNLKIEGFIVEGEHRVELNAK